MQSQGREPSMEDILASIKKVIAEEKELRAGVEPVDSVEPPLLRVVVRRMRADLRPQAIDPRACVFE